MLNRKPKQISYILIISAIIISWIVVLGIFIVPIYQELRVAVPANPMATSLPIQQAALLATPTADMFPPTWTPTATPTSTSTATPVATFPAWVTWTPTATWTPRPPTATTRASVTKKREAIRKYRKLFKKAAAEYDLDWELMAEQGYYESGLNPRALGGSRDMGLMQIIPSTWRRMAREVDVTDPYDPYSNILAAAAYLDEVRAECRTFTDDDDPGCMLLAYNWGPHNARRLYALRFTWRQAPSRQRHYVMSILKAAGYEK